MAWPSCHRQIRLTIWPTQTSKTINSGGDQQERKQNGDHAGTFSQVPASAFVGHQPVNWYSIIYLFVLARYTHTHRHTSVLRWPDVLHFYYVRFIRPNSWGCELPDPLWPGLLRPIYLEFPHAGREKWKFYIPMAPYHLTCFSAGLLHWRWTIQWGPVHIFVVLAMSCFELIASRGDDGGVWGNHNESPQAWGEAKPGSYKT